MSSVPSQGHLVCCSSDFNTMSSQAPSASPTVVVSEKLARNCQTATPLTLTDPSWYLDGGATDHVVADGNSLLQQIAYKGNNKLMVGNGQYLDITHIGNTSILVETIVIQILNILVVPDIAKNLLTVSKLTHDNNLIVEFYASYCLLKDHQGKPLLQGIADKGLYKLLLLPSANFSLPFSSACQSNFTTQQ